MDSRPNIHDTLDRAPGVLDGYKDISKAFAAGTLTATERNIVLLAASVENGCTYCVPVYTLALRANHLDEEAISALREGKPTGDARTDTLAEVTRSLIRSRGALDQALRAQFLDVGFTEEQLLEVIVGIAQKTITNYANALFRPTLDEKFASARWTPPA